MIKERVEESGTERKKEDRKKERKEGSNCPCKIPAQIASPLPPHNVKHHLSQSDSDRLRLLLHIYPVNKNAGTQRHHPICQKAPSPIKAATFNCPGTVEIDAI